MMTAEQRRGIASLATVRGYQVVLDEVVKAARDEALDRLITTTDKERLWAASVEYQALKRLYETLSAVPQRMVDELKEEGDNIYA